MKSNLFKKTGVAITNAMLLSLLLIMTAGSNQAFAQAAPVIDPSLEVFGSVAKLMRI